MRRPWTAPMVIFGGGDVVRRLLESGCRHPLFTDVHVVVIAPACLSPVVNLADQWVWPLSRPTLRWLAAHAGSLYIGVPADRPLNILRRLKLNGYRGQLIVVEKPLCTPSQVEQVRETCHGTNVVVDDHWLMAPLARLLPDYLCWMRARFGELLWVDVRLDETRCVDMVNSAPFLAMGSVWGEYLYHAFSLVHHLFPNFRVDLQSARLFMTRHEGAPLGLLTFGAFAGLAGGFHRYSRTGRVAVTVSGGKGLPEDTKAFEFVFENASLFYSHSLGRIILRTPDGREKELVNHPVGHFEVVFDRWVADDPSAFQPLEDALTTVAEMSRIQASCLAHPGEPGMVVIPTTHRVGKHPLPEWPTDGFASMMAHRHFRQWASGTEATGKPAVVAKLFRVMNLPVGRELRGVSSPR